MMIAQASPTAIMNTAMMVQNSVNTLPLTMTSSLHCNHLPK